jgi:hypothetical protein
MQKGSHMSQVDFFGTTIETYRGQPTTPFQQFSTEEVDVVAEDIFHDGALLEQTFATLAKIKGLPTNVISAARREAWEELCWVFDLWGTPACVTFDVACDIAGADAEKLRGTISHTFASEIRLMVDAFTAFHPSERARLTKRLGPYVPVDVDRAASLH